MRGNRTSKGLTRYAVKDRMRFDTRMRRELFDQRFGDEQPLAGLRAAPFGYFLDPDYHVIERRTERDRPIARQCPGCRRPDERRRVHECRTPGVQDWKTHPYSGRFVVVIFNLGLSECRLFDDRPQDWLRPSIQPTIHQELADFAN